MISIYTLFSSLLLFLKLLAITILWMIIAEIFGYTTSAAPQKLIRRRAMKPYRPTAIRRTSSLSPSPEFREPALKDMTTLHTVPVPVEPMLPTLTSGGRTAAPRTPSPVIQREKAVRTAEKLHSRSPSPATTRRRDSLLRMTQRLTSRSPSPSPRAAPSATATPSPQRTRPSMRARALSNASTATSGSVSSSGSRSSSSRSSSASRPHTPDTRRTTPLAQSPEAGKKKEKKSESRSREREGKKDGEKEKERRSVWRRRERSVSNATGTAMPTAMGNSVQRSGVTALRAAA